ncbi:hypothetical protein FR830_22585 [Klebsiella aerogenes]|nr:hypothetical protein FR830_22585 [Klebsiella aerogenes]SFX82388.1 hypothetical protein SAMN03097705_4980 [[Enterobacter] aerogenes] [Klebsiella aerogenes]
MNKFNLCFAADVYFWTLLASVFQHILRKAKIITLRYFLEKIPDKSAGLRYNQSHFRLTAAV